MFFQAWFFHILTLKLLWTVPGRKRSSWLVWLRFRGCRPSRRTLPWRSLSGRWNWTRRKSMPKWKTRWGGHRTVHFESHSISSKAHSDLTYNRSIYLKKTKTFTKISCPIGSGTQNEKGTLALAEDTHFHKSLKGRGGPWWPKAEPLEKGSVSSLPCRARGCALLLPGRWGRCDQQPPIGGDGGRQWWAPRAVQTRRWVLFLPSGFLDSTFTSCPF